ncbi:MAG: ankyrin repeat domain-containing protein [Brevinema sp.]
MKKILLLFLFPVMGFGQSLIEAAGRNDLKAIKIMISQNANVHVKDHNGMSLLHLISDVETADLLIQKGIDINALNKFGSTPLHWAVSKTNYDLVLHLIEYGADINIADHNGNTPLHIAALITPEMIGLLLRGSARIDLQNIHKQTPLQYALAKGKPENSIYLNTSTVNTIPESKFITAKLLTVYDQRDTNLKVLEVSAHPIIQMIHTEQWDKVNLFIDRITNVNIIKDKDGNTLLHLAVLKKNRPLVKKLLQKKADPALKNNNGQTIIDLLNLLNDDNFKKYIEQLTKDLTKNKKI